jgi:hypothetical protein
VGGRGRDLLFGEERVFGTRHFVATLDSDQLADVRDCPGWASGAVIESTRAPAPWSVPNPALARSGGGPTVDGPSRTKASSITFVKPCSSIIAMWHRAGDSHTDQSASPFLFLVEKSLASGGLKNRE